MNKLEEINNKNKLVEIASSVVNKKMTVIEGCRKISGLIDIHDPKNNFLIPIIDLESETDEIPLGDIRKNFSKSYLDEIDNKFKQYINNSTSVILKICKQIIEEYSHDIKQFKNSIRDILLKNDPIKFYFRDLEKKHKYETEIKMILVELDGCKSEEQVANMIRYIFIDMYGEIPNNGKETLNKIGKEIWSLLTTYDAPHVP